MTSHARAGNQAGFAPLREVDGYHPLEDHGLIGDGHTAALVGRDGAICWLCVPRFDSPALFTSLLDRERGGHFVLAPDDVAESRQYYDGETAVLCTEFRTRDGGLVRLTDVLPLRSDADLSEDSHHGQGRLLRRAEVLHGDVRLQLRLRPRGPHRAERSGDGLTVSCEGLHVEEVHLAADRPLDGLDTTYELRQGDRLTALLSWDGDGREVPRDVDAAVRATAQAWRGALDAFHYAGPRHDLVRRSAITLKLLDHLPNGAIIAAPTSSLPERIGGERNWDYRYTWVRDAAFSVYALRRIGLGREARAFLDWVLRTTEKADRPHVLYDVEGGDAPPEVVDEELEGYRGSTPVRWGNAAAHQAQHDVFGEVLDCAYQWAVRDGEIGPELWSRLTKFVEHALEEWDTPDHGIWEVRSAGEVFTYSAAMCQVALDRAARLAERFGLQGDVEGWRRKAGEVRDAILTRAWDDEREAITGQFGGGALDASVLTLPMRRVLPADHPRMRSTTEAVHRELGAGDGLVYRYLVDEVDDGLEGDEGAFLLCSFWLVDNLALQGRTDEALEIYERTCDRASPLGLLPEQIDPDGGGFLGNFPQAFSHVGVVSSGVTLGRALARRGDGPERDAALDRAYQTAAHEDRPFGLDAGGHP